MKPLHVTDQPDSSPSATSVLSGPYASEFSESVTSDINTTTSSISGFAVDAMLLARKSLTSAPDVKTLQTAAAAQLRRNVNAALVAWYYPTRGQIGQTDRIEGLLCPTDGIAESLDRAMRQTARRAIQSGAPCVQRLTGEPNGEFQLVALPVAAFSGQCLLVLLESHSLNPRVSSESWASLLMLSGLMNEWALQCHCNAAADEAKTVATLIELVAHVQAAANSDAACQRLADSLQSLLQADTVYVGLCRSGSKDVNLTAIAGGGTIDAFSEETRLIESVLQETQLRSAGGTWPVRDPDNRHALLSHQQLSEEWYGCTVVSAPLQTETGTGTGAILVTFSGTTATEHAANAERFLRAAGGSLGSCLEILQKLADSRWLKWTQSIRALLTRPRLELASWACGAMAIVLLLPIDLHRAWQLRTAASGASIYCRSV